MVDGEGKPDEGKPDGERLGCILKEAEKRGLLLIRCGAYGGQVVRWLPPLIVQPDQFDWAMDVFRETLKATG